MKNSSLSLFTASLISMFVFCSNSTAAVMPIKTFLQRPKLVLVVVIDQFRADYLTRMADRFVKPGDKGQVGGFRFLMEQGAYFPFAEYDVLQSMTCPGHAMISTGSTPDMNGISVNEWFDRKDKRMTYCAEDLKDGMSPRKLRTSTFGDELKNSGAQSKIISLALKDRSAIMLGGHRADLALWFDSKTNGWVTSTYYRASVPDWVKPLNQKLTKEKDQEYIWKTARFERKAIKGTKQAMVYPYGTQLAFDAATQALKSENLGKSKSTDILSFSLSNHDYMGHLVFGNSKFFVETFIDVSIERQVIQLGPNSPEIEELTLAEDQQLSQFLTEVKKHLGSLQDVVIALTADHGIAPMTEEMNAAKMDAGRLDYLALYRNINERLDKKFGVPKNKEWIAASKYFHFYLNTDTLKEKDLSAEVVEDEVRTVLLSIKGVHSVFTRTDYLKARWPVGVIGDQLKRQYLPEVSGDVLLIPRPFYMEKDDNNVTHMTGYAYDRQVPLILFGAKVKAGVYTQPVKIIDLAPTLSFILGTVAPATSQGHLLQVF